MRWIRRKKVMPAKKLPRWHVLLSSTMAAWVQALGALIALWLAVQLAYDSRQDARTKALLTFSQMLLTAESTANEMELGCSMRVVAERFEPQIDDAIELLKVAPLTELPTGQAQAAILIRRYFVEGKAVIQQLKQNDLDAGNRAIDEARCKFIGKFTSSIVASTGEALRAEMKAVGVSNAELKGPHPPAR